MKSKVVLTFFLCSLLVFTASVYAFSFGDIPSWLSNFFRITGYVTYENETNTTTNSLLPCPSECCQPSQTYQTKVCEYPKTCKDGKCVDTTTLYTTTTMETTTTFTIKEQVKCIFTDTDTEQKCYGDGGRFGCYGLGSCIADVVGEAGTKIIWKSSCSDVGYTETTINGNTKYVAFKCSTQTAAQSSTTTTAASGVKEQVKCVFANSVSDQKCFNEYGQTCGGTGTCVIDVSGEKGKMLTWKSTCGGYAYTMMDGSNEYAEFNCQAATQTTNQTSSESIPVSSAVQTSQPVKEQVQCRFLNSDVLFNPHTAAAEKCYSERFGCLWDGNVATEESGKRYAYCVAEVSGYMGTKLTWKSSCGGYAYTVMDGNNENVEFTCVPSTNVTTEQISGKGFKYAYLQCYDGLEQKIPAPGSEPCQTSEFYQRQAANFCKNHCYADGSKCGVNSFSVSGECYIEAGTGQFFTTTTSTPVSSASGGESAPTQTMPSETTTSSETTKVETPMLICKDSCPLEEKCYPFGYRKDGKYCSDEGAFKEQLKENVACENNFECSTNVCVDGKCMSSSLIQMIMNFFKSLFGSK